MSEEYLARGSLNLAYRVLHFIGGPAPSRVRVTRLKLRAGRREAGKNDTIVHAEQNPNGSHRLGAYRLAELSGQVIQSSKVLTKQHVKRSSLMYHFAPIEEIEKCSMSAMVRGAPFVSSNET